MLAHCSQRIVSFFLNFEMDWTRSMCTNMMTDIKHVARLAHVLHGRSFLIADNIIKHLDKTKYIFYIFSSASSVRVA